MDKKKPSIAERIREQLKEFEDEIDHWEKKSRKYDDVLKAEFNRHADEFRAILKEGQLNVDALKHKGEKDLNKVKDVMSFTTKALKKSFDVFVEQFKDRK